MGDLPDEAAALGELLDLDARLVGDEGHVVRHTQGEAHTRGTAEGEGGFGERAATRLSARVDAVFS